MDKNDKNLNLSTKQSEIFKLIVEAYIETGEPIGSKKLLEKIKKDKELREKVMIIVERKDVVYKLRPDVEIVSNI